MGAHHTQAILVLIPESITGGLKHCVEVWLGPRLIENTGSESRPRKETEEGADPNSATS